MSGTPNDPHLGDTLGPSHAGRVDPAVGDTQSGSRSHERPSYSDPIVRDRSEVGAAADRVPGAASTTPDPSPDGEAGNVDTGGMRAEGGGDLNRVDNAPMQGAGTPVRRAGPSTLVGESPDASGSARERDMHRTHPPTAT